MMAGSKRGMRWASLGAAAVLAGTALAATTGITASQQAEPTVAASAVSIASQAGGRALLELELADGTEHSIGLEGGSVRVDGRRVGTYEPGGELETTWREFLRRQAGAEPAAVTAALLDFSPPELTGAEARAAEALREGIRTLLRPPAPERAVEAQELVAPDGTGLAIAPGGISFEALARDLERLRHALEGLGEAAEGADERLALIVHDDFAVAEGRSVDGNLALLGGDLALSGTVRGDVLVLDGTLRLLPPAQVEGDVLQVGGAVEHEGGRVAGELLSLRLVEPAVAPDAPAVTRERPERVRRPARAERRPDPGFAGRTARNVGRALQGLLGVVSAYIGFAILGLIAVYFARPQLEMVADTTRRSFGRSFALGLAGQVLFFPALLVLVVLVITWLVLPFFLLAVAVAAVGGYLAAAHAAGELFAQRRYRFQWMERLRRSNSYYFVLSGLALLLLPFALAAALWLFGGLTGGLRALIYFVAVTGTWVVATAGFGSVLLTRGGTREFARGDEWMRTPTGAKASGGGGA